MKVVVLYVWASEMRYNEECAVMCIYLCVYVYIVYNIYNI